MSKKETYSTPEDMEAAAQKKMYPEQKRASEARERQFILKKHLENADLVFDRDPSNDRSFHITGKIKGHDVNITVPWAGGFGAYWPDMRGTVDGMSITNRDAIAIWNECVEAVNKPVIDKNIEQAKWDEIDALSAEKERKANYEKAPESEKAAQAVNDILKKLGKK